MYARIVITVGLLTLAYTTVGGLYVSIATDQGRHRLCRNSTSYSPPAV